MEFMNTLLLKNIKAYDFEHIYQDMQLQFPENELKPFGVFENLINNDKYAVFSVFDGDKEIGYILYIKLKSGRLWLDYIAVKKEFHSKGYGKRIMSLLHNCYLEVEKPDACFPDTLRRIKFYTLLGAKKLNINYIYPNLEGGLPMDLYYLGDDLPSNEDILNDIKNVFFDIHSDIKSINKIIELIVNS